MLSPKQEEHSQKLAPLPDMDPGLQESRTARLLGTTEETLGERSTTDAVTHIDSLNAERRDERTTAKVIQSTRLSKRVDLVSCCWLMQSFGVMPTSSHSS